MSNLIKSLEENGCIEKKENIRLKSGNISNTYYNIKKAAGITETLEIIISELEKIVPKEASIVGVSTGGIPFASILSYKLKTNFAYVRSSKKEYGLESMIEGHIDPNKTIYIIEDVCTTGSSLIKVKNIIEEKYKNSKIKLVSIIDRQKNNLDIISVEKVKWKKY